MQIRLDTISDECYLKAVAINNLNDEVIFHLRFRYGDYLRYRSNVLDEERRSLKSYVVRYANYYVRCHNISLDNVDVFVSVDNLYDDNSSCCLYFRR